MLSDAQRSRLAERLRQGRTGVAGGIPRRPPDLVELPLSYGQEQLWFIDQFAPGLPVYTIASAVRIGGPLDAEALGLALDDLRERHEVLRTRLVTVDGRPRQVIDPPSAEPLPVSTVDGEAGFAALADLEVRRPFDLAAGPLFRARLARLGPQEHVLLFCVHHTVFDGWSEGNFVRELAALYRARTGGGPAGLPELPIQYADYAIWERHRLQGETLENLVGYWRTVLDGVATVPVPADRARPRLQDFDGGVESIRVGGHVLDALRALARREGTTLFVPLLAAIHILLHRYTGTDDITVGTASANRGRAELAPLIGYLVNTLPIRVDLSGDPTVVETLHRVQAATVEAQAHQDLPFPKLVEALRVDRDPGRTPIVQIGFTMLDGPAGAVDAGAVTMRSAAVDLAVAKVDLNFFLLAGEDGIRIDLSYATALFDPETIRALLGHLRELLTGIAADPTRRLSQLPMLTQAEVRRELVEWNDTAVEYPVMCLHESFERQVERTPDEIAAVLGAERVTYAELNAQANQVARVLRDRGVGPEVLVGIGAPPSVRRIVALLGIMKAGGGYVPLDPELPAERLQYMVDDAGLRLVVGSGLPVTGVDVIDLDAEWTSWSTVDSHNPNYPVRPDNVVYVIYTSGSTGRPKGVVVEHAPVVNYITGMIRHWPVGPGDRHLQFASLSFDVSVMDMFVALCSGETAVLADRETLHSPPRLAELMRRERVTFACLPPAVVGLLTGQDLPDLRVLISAGEALTAELMRAWLRPGLRFCNGYGPTETACGVTLMDLDGKAVPPPIGYPMPNYRAYVLDAHLNPLPVGAIGELHIGGLCHARGYLNQPELTAQRFIRDPFDDRPGARLYRTGDLVRRRRDGAIVFVGRTDNQVKIRGLRVELGEIEAALSSHPDVSQALVVTAPDASGTTQLVGYAVSAAPAADLRQHLAGMLPAYMVPTHLVVLDHFPLTPNGKIDRRALPDPETVTRYSPPRTLIETLLADLYAAVLGAARVGIDDGFFDLGGNSLQAMQLVSRLHADLAVDVGVTAVFLSPTVRQLSVYLREKHGFEDEAISGVSLVPLAEGDVPLFLVHPIGGTVYPYAHLAKELAGAYEVRGLEAAGLTADTTPADSLAAMVDSYVDAVRAAQPSGPYRLVGWSMGGLLAFEMARRLVADGETVALLGLLDAPSELPPGGWATEERLAALFVADAARTLDLPTEPPIGATPEERLDWLAAHLGDPAARIDIDRRFAVYRAHSHAMAGYRPQGTVAAPAIVAIAEGSPDTVQDWRNAIDGPVDALHIDGGHHALLQPSGARRLAEALRAADAGTRT